MQSNPPAFEYTVLLDQLCEVSNGAGRAWTKQRLTRTHETEFANLKASAGCSSRRQARELRRAMKALDETARTLSLGGPDFDAWFGKNLAGRIPLPVVASREQMCKAFFRGAREAINDVNAARKSVDTHTKLMFRPREWVLQGHRDPSNAGDGWLVSNIARNPLDAPDPSNVAVQIDEVLETFATTAALYVAENRPSSPLTRIRTALGRPAVEKPTDHGISGGMSV